MLDRLIQQAIAQVLTPLFDCPVFTTQLWVSARDAGLHDAVKAAQGYIREGYDWAVDMDLEKFFDRVNHDKLMACVARVVKDRQVLKLIRCYLDIGRAGQWRGAGHRRRHTARRATVTIAGEHHAG